MFPAAAKTSIIKEHMPTLVGVADVFSSFCHDVLWKFCHRSGQSSNQENIRKQSKSS